jgi:hypothetical protein
MLEPNPLAPPPLGQGIGFTTIFYYRTTNTGTLPSVRTSDV